MRIARQLGLCITGAVGLCLAALACGSGATSFQFKFAEQRAELANGLRVVVLPDPSTELVEVDVRYAVGSSSDPRGKAGLAHLVEHLMFLQRPDGPGSPPLMRYINQLTTFSNAYTNWDSTHYMMMGRKEGLESMLQIEAMRLFYGCQTISEAEFVREREVVRNEIRQRTGTPEGQIPQLILSAVYPAGHAYSRMIGGNDEQLANISLQDACDFMARYYVPANATVIVAGNTTREEVAPLVTKWFGKLAKKPQASVAHVAPLALQRKRVSHVVDVERPWIYAAWALPPRNTRDGEIARFALAALTGRFSRLSSDWEFATAVAPAIYGGELAPIFVLGVELRGESRRSQAHDFIMKAAKRAHWGMHSDQFDEGDKARARASFVMRLESLTNRTNMLGDMAQFDRDIAWTSDQQLWERRFKTSDDLDGGQIKRMLERVLDPKKAVIVDVKASDQGLRGDRRARTGLQSQSHDGDRELVEVDPAEAHRPLPIPRRSDQLGQARRFQLGNGMKVVLRSFSSMPIVSAALSFDVGAAHEPKDRAGLAGVAGERIRGSISAMLLFTDYGIRWRSRVDDDSTMIVVQGMEPYLDSMIHGLERYITAGQYDQEALEKWQRNMRYRFDSQRYREGSEFDRQLYGAIYGPEHPYATQGPPTRSSLGRLDRDAAMRFKNKHYSAKNATLVIAGRFDPKVAEKHIRKHFGDWSGGHKDDPVSPAMRARSGPEYIGVVASEGPQMAVRIAYPGPAGMDAGHPARLVLQEMLNLRVSRIRQMLGSTYGVYARRSVQVGPSMYEIGGRVDAKRAGESLAVIRASIDDLRRGYRGFDTDFARARRKVVQGLLGQSTVSLEVALRLSTISRHQLSPDYYDRLLEQVAAVTPAQVEALIAQELRPDREVIVGMADRETLTGAFRQAGLENVKLVEPK